MLDKIKRKMKHNSEATESTALSRAEEEWLIEQAEKVEVLEKYLNNAGNEVLVIGDESEKYKNALEEIAYHVATPLGKKEDFEKTTYEFIDIAKRALGY